MADVTVILYRSDGKNLGKAKTNKQGRFEIAYNFEPYEIFFVVVNSAGRELLSTRNTPLAPRAQRWIANLEVPASVVSRLREKNQRQTVLVGSLLLDAEYLETAEPELVLDIARLMVGRKVAKSAVDRIARLSPDLLPDRHLKRTLCGTQILQTIEELIRHKKWPREIALTLDRILSLREFGFGGFVELCPNFSITYDLTGPAAVDPSTAAANVLDPGTANVIGSLPAGGAPAYIKLVCFWLERALASYVSPPFSMLNPAAGGRIAVVINNAPFGTATPGTFFLNNALAPDLLCAVAVHELFHMVQFEYGGSGVWSFSLTEGGAVFAEDSAADSMNRYLDEACTNFNGVGVQSNPNLSLSTAGYKCSLFFKYIAEQQSSRTTPLDEPKIEVDTYRTLLEHCSAGSYSTNDVKQAIKSLPWYQGFYEFGYLDAARFDLTTSETTFGNYVLACYLKDLGTNTPDRRYDLMEDDDNIFIDDVLRATIDPTLPSNTTLIPPVLSGTGTITASTGLSFASSVNAFATRYYEMTIDAAVTNVSVVFTAGMGFTSRIFQIALIDQDGAVRDIHRSDKASYSKFLTSIRNGKRLVKILCAVSGTEAGGSFNLSATSATAGADVMVTRWNTAITNEYEIDSSNWSWTWVSPDIWVDNDNDGIADGVVFFNFDNQLHIRLHNKGNASASGISVNFFYQDASGGLSDAAWLPVQNTSGVTQSLTGLTLAAGATNDFVVDWSPAPSGASHHFCIRAIVYSPDVNTDNKRVLSNFGNVQVEFSKFSDLVLIRRNIFDVPEEINLRVVRRMSQEFEISPRDLINLESITLKPGETFRDTIRISHRQLNQGPPHEHQGRGILARIENRPDPTTFYPADPRTLPPGIADRPLVTVVHEVNGRAVGGFTYVVEVAKSGTTERPRAKTRRRARSAKTRRRARR